MALDNPSFRQALTSFRKQRSLLTRAYRSYKRQGQRASHSRYGAVAYENAARVVREGAAQGITVGGIQSYEQIRDNINLSLAKQADTTKRIANFLSGQSAARDTLNTDVSVEPEDEGQTSVGGLSMKNQDDASPPPTEEEEDEYAYYSPFLRNRTLLS
jgi:hypothetical protein